MSSLNSKAQLKRINTILLASTTALGVMAATSPALAVGNLETPVVKSFDAAQVEFSGNTANGRLNVKQNSARTVIDWESFNIGKDARVNFNQTQGASSVAINKVTGAIR